MPRSGEKPLLMALVLMAAVIVATAGVAFSDIRTLATLRDAAIASHQILDVIHEIVRAEYEAESGQRGYLLSGDEIYLASYRTGVDKVHQWLTEFDRLTPDDPGDRPWSAVLHARTEDKLTELARTIALRRTRGLDAALAVVGTNRGKMLMDQIVAATDALEQQANERLLQNRREFDRARRDATISCFIAGVVGLLGLWSFWAFVRRHIDIIHRGEQAMFREKERLRVTLASIGDAVIVTDAEGRITFLNAVAEALTGWRNTEAGRRPLEEVFVIRNEQTGEPLLNPARRVMAKGITVGLANHTVLIARDGTHRPIDDSAAPIRDGNGHLFGAILVFRDVTERRRAENQLKEADRRKDEFLATLAHELRNPLAPLANAWRLVGDPRSDTEVRAKAGGIIDRQLAIMVRLIDDLMDVARITQNKFELRKSHISVNRLIDNAIEMSEPQFAARGHRLTLIRPETDFEVVVDPTRVAQAICNLLNNAAKFTPPGGGTIVLSVWQEGAQWLVSVRDNGEGIPPHILEHIFNMFAQNDALATPRGGLGVGLALVKHIAGLHGGTVSASSLGPGQGAEFRLRLPVNGA
jgi:PAS domain S-box-containing protein